MFHARTTTYTLRELLQVYSKPAIKPSHEYSFEKFRITNLDLYIHPYSQYTSNLMTIFLLFRHSHYRDTLRRKNSYRGQSRKSREFSRTLHLELLTTLTRREGGGRVERRGASTACIYKGASLTTECGGWCGGNVCV